MKRLLRSRRQKMLAGICGGLAEYLNLDVTLVRVIFVVILFVGGFFVPALLYGVLYYVIPSQDEWE